MSIVKKTKFDKHGVGATERRADTDKKASAAVSAKKGEGTNGGADGSHERSHKQVAGSRSTIHEGNPDECSKHTRKE